MRELSAAEARAVQLSVLDRFDAFCRDKGFQYFLYGGTLLGAVRHHGYIPWDDDIDLIMKRREYEAFLAAAGAGGLADLELRASPTEVTYPWPFAKVADTTTYVEGDTAVRLDIGINVDIFPLDGWPDGAVRTAAHRAVMLGWKGLLTANYIPHLRERSTAKTAALAAGKGVVRAVGVQRVITSINGSAARYPCPGSAWVGATIWGRQERVPADAWNEVVELPFEGRRCPGPRGYDQILTAIYGDYMTPPPEGQRVAHANRSFAR